MPIYEYRCRECDLEFAKLQSMSAGTDGVTCPRCGSNRVERQLSAFASGTSRGSSSSSGCAPSGSG